MMDTKVSEYNPEPPIPWKARNTILLGLVPKSYSTRLSTYNCTMVWAPPHAIENTKKMKAHPKRRVLKPQTSLSFAVIRRKAGR
jgi:hypothetical protein